jgi:hypothetical protein
MPRRRRPRATAHVPPIISSNAKSARHQLESGGESDSDEASPSALVPLPPSEPPSVTRPRADSVLPRAFPRFRVTSTSLPHTTSHGQPKPTFLTTSDSNGDDNSDAGKSGARAPPSRSASHKSVRPATARATLRADEARLDAFDAKLAPAEELAEGAGMCARPRAAVELRRARALVSRG